MLFKNHYSDAMHIFCIFIHLLFSRQEWSVAPSIVITVVVVVSVSIDEMSMNIYDL
jgi:hypothetical protein